MFGEFTLSPTQRRLLRGVQELPLIPRYFDLLCLLVERRQEAVHRRDIFDVVWSDVVVSDSALTQAIRILRRTLDDDPREPRYIRTVSRHGYRFVFPDVVEEPEGVAATPSRPRADAPALDHERVEAALGLLCSASDRSSEDEAARQEAAELLHRAGTEAALARLGLRPGHERARAYLRDARWSEAGAGGVAVLGRPGAVRTLVELTALRLRRAGTLVRRRWLSAVGGGGLAGLIAGTAGGGVLCLGPGSRMPWTVPVVLGLLGMCVGGLGAAGVAGGLALGEALVRSWRWLALAVLGALGGGSVAGLAHLVGRWTIQGLFGRDLSPVAGGFEGLVLGGAVGLGYAAATRGGEGMATPRGRERLRVALVTGGCAAAAALALAATGSHLGAMSLDFMARSFPGSQVTFDPLARLLGEATPGRLTHVAIGAGEGLAFGFGLSWGLTRRPL